MISFTTIIISNSSSSIKSVNFWGICEDLCIVLDIEIMRVHMMFQTEIFEESTTNRIPIFAVYKNGMQMLPEKADLDCQSLSYTNRTCTCAGTSLGLIQIILMFVGACLLSPFLLLLLLRFIILW